MGRYCITAANHENPDNHCASTFKVWKYDNIQTKWLPLGGKPIGFVNDLLKNGHEVLSAKENETTISIGAPVEIELRITKNESKYKISDMPTFKI